MKSTTDEEKPLTDLEKIHSRIIELIKQNGGKIIIGKKAKKPILKNIKKYYPDKNSILERLYRIHSKLDIILDQIQPQM